MNFERASLLDRLPAHWYLFMNTVNEQIELIAALTTSSVTALIKPVTA